MFVYILDRDVNLMMLSCRHFVGGLVGWFGWTDVLPADSVTSDCDAFYSEWSTCQ